MEAEQMEINVTALNSRQQVKYMFFSGKHDQIFELVVGEKVLKEVACDQEVIKGMEGNYRSYFCQGSNFYIIKGQYKYSQGLNFYQENFYVFHEPESEFEKLPDL